MIEADKVVTNIDLGEDWLNNANNSFEQIKKIITYLNESNSFDLYDNNEDLSLEALNNKQSIKETLVVLPLTYVMEKFLKSIILYNNMNETQNRATAVREILNNVKSSSSVQGNLHNAALLIDYINSSIDTHFINFFGNLYNSRRNGYNGEEARSNPISMGMLSKKRIEYATECFKNAFIEFRYLYEKNDQIESVDLVKLIDYVASIRDVAFYTIERLKSLSIFDKYGGIESVLDYDVSLFGRDHEYRSCDGVDILLDLREDTDYNLKKLYRKKSDKLSEDEKTEFSKDKNKILEDIFGIETMLNKEYKAEFTKANSHHL